MSISILVVGYQILYFYWKGYLGSKIDGILAFWDIYMNVKSVHNIMWLLKYFITSEPFWVKWKTFNIFKSYICVQNPSPVRLRIWSIIFYLISFKSALFNFLCRTPRTMGTARNGILLVSACLRHFPTSEHIISTSLIHIGTIRKINQYFFNQFVNELDCSKYSRPLDTMIVYADLSPIWIA